MLVPVVALMAVVFTLQGGTTIVALLLMGYTFVTQLFPSLLASLLPRNPVTREGRLCRNLRRRRDGGGDALDPHQFAGLLPGLPETLRDLNIGIVALLLNLVATGAVSAVTRRRAAYA